MKKNKLLYLIPICLILPACIDLRIGGENSIPQDPYYITTTPMIIKNIQIPVGTKLTYGNQKFKTLQQNKIIPESKLTDIEFPENANITWGGVPITQIHQFFNTEMRGYTVYPDFQKMDVKNQSNFSKRWQSCGDGIGITIRNTQDWSFNKNNITDVESCSVLYQRYFKDNAEQQQFLDQLYHELKQVQP